MSETILTFLAGMVIGMLLISLAGWLGRKIGGKDG